MTYLILYSVSLFFFVAATILFVTRNHWLHHVQDSIPFRLGYRPLSSSTFHDDAAAGLHSSNFDLSSNIESGDGRAGLDEQGKREVKRIMQRRGVGFDEARRMVMLQKFKKGGVGEDGIPRDPKFVSFS